MAFLVDLDVLLTYNQRSWGGARVSKENPADHKAIEVKEPGENFVVVVA